MEKMNFSQEATGTPEKMRDVRIVLDLATRAAEEAAENEAKK